LPASRANKSFSNQQFIGLTTIQPPSHLHPQCWTRLTISRKNSRIMTHSSILFFVIVDLPETKKSQKHHTVIRCHRHSRLFDIYKFPFLVLHVSLKRKKKLKKLSRGQSESGEWMKWRRRRSLRAQCSFFLLFKDNLNEFWRKKKSYADFCFH
jgi:hypothetical protein